jgi:hypothetical protein
MSQPRVEQVWRGYCSSNLKPRASLGEDPCQVNCIFTPFNTNKNHKNNKNIFCLISFQHVL